VVVMVVMMMMAVTLGLGGQSDTHHDGESNKR
jgi:hypothetical protein